MLKKHLVVILVASLLNLFLSSVSFAGGTEEKKKVFAEKVKVGIAKLGTGSSAKVEVKLYDKTKIKGYVYKIAVDHFVVMDEKSGAGIVVPYASVKQVKGNNLSKGVRIAIIVGIAIGFYILLAFLVGRDG
ncbi:MAG: hypothetical protein ACRD6X_01145 [Pyrinomonadaceae bacterium]